MWAPHLRQGKQKAFRQRFYLYMLTILPIYVEVFPRLTVPSFFAREKTCLRDEVSRQHSSSVGDSPRPANRFFPWQRSSAPSISGTLQHISVKSLTYIDKIVDGMPSVSLDVSGAPT